jgi:hypothetical protein
MFSQERTLALRMLKHPLVLPFHHAVKTPPGNEKDQKKSVCLQIQDLVLITSVSMIKASRMMEVILKSLCQKIKQKCKT